VRVAQISGLAWWSGIMETNEQVRIFSLPSHRLPAPGYPLRGVRAHPGLPAWPGQRGADPALQPDAPGGPQAARI